MSADVSLLILYATETGNALDAAEQMARETQRLGYIVRIASTDTYPSADLVHEHLVIFMVSTTGSGVEPRSMSALWSLLIRADLPTDLFDGVSFAVFGLGDSAYEKFCWAAKKLVRRLSSLGAHEICPHGEGDEQHPLGIEGELDPWMRRVLSIIKEQQPSTISTLWDAASLPPPRISIQSETSKHKEDPDPLENKSDHYLARIRCNERITAQDWFQDVRHIDFQFDQDIQYAPGDVAVIQPLASPQDVESFLTIMGWGNIADETFTILPAPHGLPISPTVPRKTCLRTLFTRHLDLNAVPRRSFFQFLRHFPLDELELEKLNEFCSDEGADDLYAYCFKVRRTIREVTEEFRSLKIPREYIFDIFPPLRPRQFSIASSVKVHPKHIHLCVAIVQYRTKLKVPRRGVCTTYLSSLEPGHTLHICIQKGPLSLPEDPSTPVICVGPGTGVAPMRSLINERIHLGSTKNTLYFGCRSTEKDQHYAHEWKSHVDAGHLTYRVAFSRDGAEGTARIYVQDLITMDRERIWELIDKRNAWVYIAGSSNKMPLAVKGAIENAAQVVGGQSEEQAKEYLRILQREGRLVEECWS
ncbi:riboflavin synthase domain-like protein [Rickenella mellea]|uniref:NADPH-dependent diflavin oxidoreductase 1 n=1 Tax=Rickenella mellea TaxID=50990 RepID=A0A4Y7PJZ9_9AGAM|nr:riboflavin synthase domain-like protein [Rickenella mellea]